MNRLKSATALGGLVLAAAGALPAAAQDQALIDAAKAEGTRDDGRPAARLVQLRRGDRGLQGQVRPRGQRAQPGRRLRRRARGDPRQQGQQGPAGARRRSTSASPSARRPQKEGLLQPYKVSTWDDDPRRRQGPRRPLVRRLLRRAVLRGERRPRARAAGRLGGPPEAGVRQLASRSPATRAPRTRRSSASMPPASPPAAQPGEDAGQKGLEFFAELNKAGNFVPVDRQVRHARPGRDPDRRSAGTTTRCPAATR